MRKTIHTYAGLFFGLVSLLLLTIIFLNHPTDGDAGPMLAYTFLFLFPMVFGMVLLSAVSLAIGMGGLIQNRRATKGMDILSLVVASPGLLFFILLLIRFFLLEKEPVFPEESAWIHTRSTPVALQEKTVYLTGFTLGPDSQRRRIYISDTPYFDKDFKEVDAYFCQGNAGFELFYAHDVDSVYLYIPKAEPMYHDVHATKLDNVPVRAIQLNNAQLDSLKEQKSEQIHQFRWR